MSNEEPITNPSTGPSVTTDMTGDATYVHSEQNISVPNEQLLGTIPKAVNSIPTSFHFDIEKILGQWRLVAEKSFSSASGVNAEFWFNFDYTSLYRYRIIRNFRHFKADLEFMVEFTESPQVVGMACIVYIPTTTDPYIAPPNKEWQKIWPQYPHQLVKLGCGKNYLVKLPWINTLPAYYNDKPFGSSDLKNIDNGMMVITLLTPISAVEGVSNEVHIKVWSRFVNPQYEGYIPYLTEL